jgi:hypothetical protein
VTTAGVTCSTTPAYEAVARGAGAGAAAAAGAAGAAAAVGPKPSDALHPMTEPVSSRATAAALARHPARLRPGLEISV